MKVVCSKENLEKSLKTVRSAVPTRTTLDILRTVLLETEENYLKITANDTTLGIETKIDALVMESGEQMAAYLDEHDRETDPDLWEKGIYVVAQTTIKQETFDGVSQAVSDTGVPAEIKNTICNATNERQQGCLETAETVDAMVVIGDPASSNSRKLYEIASAHCKNAYFVADFRELSLKDLADYNRIGVAAGASTPEIAIKEVISRSP